MNNFVAKELAVCPVCGNTHMTGVLIHKDMKEIKNQVTHEALCPEHQEMFDDGFIALVEVEDTHHKGGKRVPITEPNRTGRLVHIKKDVFDNLITENVDDSMPLVFMAIDAVEHIVSMFED